MSQMEILSNQREAHLSLEVNRSEIQEQLHLVLDSIQDIHAILKEPDPKIKNHMLHVQEAIHANVAGPEQRKSLQQHLLKIHRQTELLPPIIDRMASPVVPEI
jgi:son of sevenless